MEICYIKTPIGTLKISGTTSGVSEIIFNEELEISNRIPEILQECVTQIEEYFSKNRTVFTFKINQNGTNFQEKVWQELTNYKEVELLESLTVKKTFTEIKSLNYDFSNSILRITGDYGFAQKSLEFGK